MDCCSRHAVRRLWGGGRFLSIQRVVLLVLLGTIVAESAEATEREVASRRTNIAHCRDSCIFEFLSSVEGNSAHAQRDACMKANVCAGCWDACEKLRNDMTAGKEICRDTSLCPTGCVHACRFFKLEQQQNEEKNNWEPRRQNVLNILSNVRPQSLRANQKLFADQESPEIVSILELPRDTDFCGCSEMTCILWIVLIMLVILLLAAWIIILIINQKFLKSETMNIEYSSEIERQTV